LIPRLAPDNAGGILVKIDHRTWLPIALFAAGVALVVAAVSAGLAELTLFFVFPVITGTSPVFYVGVLLIVLGFFVGFILMMMGRLEIDYHMEHEVHEGNWKYPVPPPGEQPKTQYGGVILIGPIPIAFGSNRNIAIFMLVAGIVLLIAFIAAVLVVR